ncbi:MAG: PaaI family thioesterase [Acidimicrobiia bacterium]
MNGVPSFPNLAAGMGRDVLRYARLDLEEIEPLHIRGRTRAIEHLRGPHGNIRAGALLTMLDTAGGICGGLAALPEGWVVSTNMSACTVRTDQTGPLRVDGRVVRKGRNNVVTAVQIFDDADGALVVDGVLTSAILVPEHGPPQWERPLRLSMPDPDDGYQPMDEWLGLREADPGTIEIDVRDGLRNPWGILHGGVVASLVDAAAVHVTGGGVTSDVVLHYLAPNRTGPVRARAAVLGTRSDGTVVRVEVRDEGAARATAVAVATVADR